MEAASFIMIIMMSEVWNRFKVELFARGETVW